MLIKMTLKCFQKVKVVMCVIVTKLGLLYIILREIRMGKRIFLKHKTHFHNISIELMNCHLLMFAMLKSLGEKTSSTKLQQSSYRFFLQVIVTGNTKETSSGPEENPFTNFPA